MYGRFRLVTVLAIAILLCALLAGSPALANLAADIERIADVDPRGAVTHASAQLSEAKAQGDLNAELRALRQILRVRVDLEELDGTQEMVEHALSLAEKLSDTDAQAEMLMNLAMVFHAKRQFQQAQKWYERAERFATSHRQWFHLVRVAIQWARLDENQTRGSEALARLNVAYPFAERSGDRFAMSRIHNRVANILFLRRDMAFASNQSAIDEYKKAIALIDIREYPTYSVRLLYNFGVYLQRFGDTPYARTILLQALGLADRIQYAQMRGSILVALGELEFDDKHYVLALQHLDAATVQVASSTRSIQILFRVRIARAKALARLGNWERALVSLEESRQLLVNLESPTWDVSYYETATAMRAEHGDYEEAYRLSAQLRQAEKAAATARNDAAVAELRTKFDVERKERENAELRAREQAVDARRWLVVLALSCATLLTGGLALALRLRMQQKLRAASALKAAIVDNAMEAIVTADAQGRIVEFNPAAEAVFDLPRSEAIGQPFEMLLPEQGRARQRQILAELASGAGSLHLGTRQVLQALRADGSEFPIEAVRWRAQLDGAMHYSISIRDITEQQRSSETIERQRNELRQSEKLTTMGGLLAGVAHELNNPLSVVMGRAALLEESTAGTPVQLEAQRVREAASRCVRIVRTFLNMARQRKSTRTEVQLNDVAQGAAEMLGYALRTHRVKLNLQLAPGLPSVLADGDQVGQVVLNLIVNAQQAMEATEGPRTLSICTGWQDASHEHPGRLWLRVVDSGPGVPKSLADRIFSPFFTTKAEGTGTGMGLSVSRAIAAEHGGDLVLEPCDSGAAFLFWIPLAPPQAAPAAQPQLGVHAAQASPGARVLVVDDEPELVELMCAMLNAVGFEAIAAHSGSAALDLLERSHFDALVSDIRMPDMDGATLWRLVQQRHPTLATRMLFVTGDTLSPNITQLLADSGCSALDKPFSPADLIAQVSTLSSNAFQRPGDSRMLSLPASARLD